MILGLHLSAEILLLIDLKLYNLICGELEFSRCWCLWQPWVHWKVAAEAPEGLSVSDDSVSSNWEPCVKQQGGNMQVRVESKMNTLGALKSA